MRLWFLCGLLALAFVLPAQDSSRELSTAGFDAPLKKVVLDLGRSPYQLPSQTAKRIELSCYYFASYMVKEYDEGQKGAEWLAIVPNGKSGAAPSCTKSRAPGERAIKWPGGYFFAAKANLVFFNGAGGGQGGMPFGVFDARTGKMILEDVAYQSTYINKRIEVDSFDRLRVGAAPDGSI